ncbi:carboxypeptidase regulatory-like domain-containing protein [Dokdonella ginsengisoli]|uniref:Carboxypeptidase regulatory-like domain-containing protein n=1 Tax=Dokdonella ginsengisoli TaxID=363846 RepID=A0ABV9QWA9_9GAMM
MNLPLIAAVVIALAALAGIVRSRRAPRRRLARIGLQILAAAALYACLFPPHTREDFAADELVVLTPGATAAQLAALPLAAKAVALPGVAADAAVERVPDLGTALRRHAQAQRLRIVGGGLPQRDRDAARGRVVEFDAAPLPGGVVELDAPVSVPVGGVFRVDGRVDGVPDARVELRDPSGAVVAAQAPDAQGRFSLQAVAKGEGVARFALNVLGADGARVDSLAVPLAARAGAPLKILLLAGAPDPELKYLRRWAADAGLALDSRLALSDGVALTEGAPALDAQALQSVDLAVLDERSWAALDAQGRQVLIDAVRGGLGLLLRVTGPIAEPVAAQWAELGYRVTPSEPGAAVRLDRMLGLGDAAPALARRALTVDAPDAAPLLRADDGSPLAWSRNLGRGRVALWLLADSYRLGLAGAASAFGTLWSEATATVARARGETPPSLPGEARVDERATFCAVAPDAAVETETGARSELLVDAGGCAAYWPEAPGWHVLSSGGQRWPFHVRARDEAPALAAGLTQRATRALLVAPSSSADAQTRSLPLPRWPFFLAWLALAALLWWFERDTTGSPPRSA